MNSWFIKYLLRARHTAKRCKMYECETKDLRLTKTLTGQAKSKIML